MLAGTITGSEGLGDAAARIVAAEFGTSPDYIEQLYTFSVSTSSVKVIVAYFALVSAETFTHLQGQPSLAFYPADGLPPLDEVERGIIEYALLRLRAKLSYSNIGFYLLQRNFTLSELQDVYEIVIGQALDKRNFRRRILASGIVEPVGAKRASSHRPAALYRFAGADPATDALTPLETDWSSTS
jgi:8-oxo-dGTP diphosphatase